MYIDIEAMPESARRMFMQYMKPFIETDKSIIEAPAAEGTKDDDTDQAEKPSKKISDKKIKGAKIKMHDFEENDFEEY